MTLLRLVVTAVLGACLLAGCGGDDDDPAPPPPVAEEVVHTVVALEVAYGDGPTTVTTDIWELTGGQRSMMRVRGTDDDGVISDLTRGDEGTLVYRRGAPGIARGEGEPATSGVAARGPVAFAESLVAGGDLTPAGTAQRDGREVEVLTGDPLPFVITVDDVARARATGSRFTPRPAGATLRYLRDAATGEPVAIEVPAGSLRIPATEKVLPVPAQRFEVVSTETTPATAEALLVFDLPRAYPDLPVDDRP